MTTRRRNAHQVENHMAKRMGLLIRRVRRVYEERNTEAHRDYDRYTTDQNQNVVDWERVENVIRLHVIHPSSTDNVATEGIVSCQPRDDVNNRDWNKRADKNRDDVLLCGLSHLCQDGDKLHLTRGRKAEKGKREEGSRSERHCQKLLIKETCHKHDGKSCQQRNAHTLQDKPWGWRTRRPTDRSESRTAATSSRRTSLDQRTNTLLQLEVAPAARYSTTRQELQKPIGKRLQQSIRRT